MRQHKAWHADTGQPLKLGNCAFQAAVMQEAQALLAVQQGAQTKDEDANGEVDEATAMALAAAAAAEANTQLRCGQCSACSSILVGPRVHDGGISLLVETAHPGYLQGIADSLHLDELKSTGRMQKPMLCRAQRRGALWCERRQQQLAASWEVSWLSWGPAALVHASRWALVRERERERERGRRGGGEERAGEIFSSQCCQMSN